MGYRYTPFIWVLVASAAITGAMGVYAWRHRSVPGARQFVAIMAIAATWSLSNSLEIAGVELSTKLFWANVEYLLYSGSPVVWLALGLQFSGRPAWLTRNRLILLSIIPIITMLLAWTDGWHGLLRRDVFLDTDGPFSVIRLSRGPWFWVFVAYSWALLLATLALLGGTLLRSRGVFRGQPLALLVGLLLVVAVNVAHNLGLAPLPRFDLTPVSFTPAGMVIAWGLFRYQLFDLAPVARDTVLESIRDGMISLDSQNRIVDFNPAAKVMLGSLSASSIGRPADQALAAWPDLVSLCCEPAVAWSEVAIDSGDGQKEVEVRASPVVDRRGAMVGRVVLMHDISERRRARSELLEQQRALAMLEERERLARELHDSLGQVLGYAGNQSQAALELLAQGQPHGASELLARLVTVAQSAQGDAREYIQGMRTGVFLGRGLLPALEEYLSQFEENTGLRTELVAPPEAGQGLFEPTTEVQLLRIVQEALTNARKHAGARGVKVTFALDSGQAEVTVEDDGQGFVPGEAPASGRPSFGLRMMRERALEFGGDLSVVSAPGQGTKIAVRLPLGRIGRLRQLKLLLVDDDALYLEGLHNLLVARGVTVLGTAGDGTEALAKARSLRPDVILMDVHMPRRDGLEAARLINVELPETKIVMLTVSAGDEDLFTAIKNGASGYLLKNTSADEMLDLLSEVARGEVAMARGLAGKVLAGLVRQGDRRAAEAPSASDRLWDLTPRQMEVLTLVAQGMPYKEVAAALSLSEPTVKFHMGQILDRLHLKSRAEAASLARRSGLVAREKMA
ncbi:MAG: response regulator [Chloroflexi bacterium]|nr:response regulator [Chloroflexota bacterium]